MRLSWEICYVVDFKWDQIHERHCLWFLSSKPKNPPYNLYNWTAFPTFSLLGDKECAWQTKSREINCSWPLLNMYKKPWSAQRCRVHCCSFPMSFIYECFQRQIKINVESLEWNANILHITTCTVSKSSFLSQVLWKLSYLLHTETDYCQR